MKNKRIILTFICDGFVYQLHHLHFSKSNVLTLFHFDEAFGGDIVEVGLMSLIFALIISAMSQKQFIKLLFFGFPRIHEAIPECMLEFYHYFLPPGIISILGKELEKLGEYAHR